jgi:hypothetical protein
MYNYIPIPYENYKYKRLPMDIKIDLVHDVFQNFISKLVQDMEYVKTIIYLNDLLTLKNNSFKYHLFKLKIFIARLSTIELLV